MDDELEIIFIALGNSLTDYNNLLEASQNLPQEKLDIILYIIKRHEELLDKYNSMIASDENIPKPIKRPDW